MSKSLLRLAVLSAPLMLSACGEGWEAQKTNSAFPYGNERTAGSGVVYVRAKMLPEKTINAAPIMTEEAIIETVPTLDAEEIFTEAQEKGSSPSKVEGKAKVEDKVEDEKQSNVTLETDAPIIKVSELSAETYIEQGSTTIETVDSSALNDAAAHVTQIEPAARGSTISDLDKEYGQAFDIDETVEIYENKVSQPMKQIIVPKQDRVDLRSQGEISLDEIYNDAFINLF